ncbi:hypothetical protein Tco_0637265 [Tanacetum coccineum]
MIPKTERLLKYTELHVVSYGIEYVAQPLLLFFSSENRLLWFRYREYDLAPLKLVFDFSIYKVWKSVGYGVSKSWIRRIDLYSSVVFGECRHGYAVSSLMDTSYWFATGRKSGAYISGGQFVARLAEHFRLLTAEILGGLTVIAPELPIIDMTELAVPAPVQAPQQPPPPPPAAARTMPKRMSRLEEDMHEIRGTLAEQREMMDMVGVTYTSYSETLREYTRCVRHRIGEANTSAAPQDPQQPDP